MNTGSRLILLATERADGPLREEPPADVDGRDIHPHISGTTRLGDAFLIAQVTDGGDAAAVREALAKHPVAARYLFHVLVSADVPLDDPMLILWGWFTRFDPLADIHPARRELAGNRVILHPPIAIDATWKPGYRRPVAFDPEVERAVDANWSKYGISLPGEAR